MNIILKKFDSLISTITALQSTNEDTSKELFEELMVCMEFYDEAQKIKVIEELGYYITNVLNSFFRIIIQF
jgi:hypothetical protein